MGVDYSGAVKSGLTAWLSETVVDSATGRLRLISMQRLGLLAGSDDRDVVNAYLVRRIQASEASLWGIDFPFGLPIELGLGDWQSQLETVTRHADGAKEFGRSLVKISETAGHGKHVRRTTDQETKTPFDCYHYRIIYQTFHGMRDVLGPLSQSSKCETAVLPFQYERFQKAKRWVVEACPSSTLKRLQLPYRLYKQSAGKPPTAEHQLVRRTILDKITNRKTGTIRITASHQKTILEDSGGDALDSVLAAVGVYHDFDNADHLMIRTHPRYPLEGRVFG